jgi:hypothetical protein
VWWLEKEKKFDVDKIIVLPVSEINADSSVIIVIMITHYE